MHAAANFGTPAYPFLSIANADLLLAHGSAELPKVDAQFDLLASLETTSLEMADACVGMASPAGLHRSPARTRVHDGRSADARP